MPRKRPNTQKIGVPTGLPYGQGEELAAAQRVQPLPQPPVASDLVQPGQGAGGAPPQGGAPPMLEQALAAAQQMPSPGEGLLAGGGIQEPLTTGLDMGPGAGSEVLRTIDQTDLFHEMARITGDPRFLHMAQMARMTR